MLLYYQKYISVFICLPIIQHNINKCLFWTECKLKDECIYLGSVMSSSLSNISSFICCHFCPLFMWSPSSFLEIFSWILSQFYCTGYIIYFIQLHFFRSFMQTSWKLANKCNRKIFLWHTQSLLKDSENLNFKENENKINKHRQNLIKLSSIKLN